MNNTVKCQLCGEPMPPGEEMFQYHGYSGPCPKVDPKPMEVRLVSHIGTMGVFLEQFINGEWVKVPVVEIEANDH